jgi:hypothetical protein
MSIDADPREGLGSVETSIGADPREGLGGGLCGGLGGGRRDSKPSSTWKGVLGRELAKVVTIYLGVYLLYLIDNRIWRGRRRGRVDLIKGRLPLLGCSLPISCLLPCILC